MFLLLGIMTIIQDKEISMKYDEFIKQVQTTAKLNSREEAERAISATLQTLAERIVGDEASNLAAQLPEQIAQYLHGREGEIGEGFSVKEFYTRVSQRQGVEPTAVPNHVRAVFSVLNTAVSSGEFAQVRHNLSKDYDELFSPQASSSQAVSS